MTEDRAGLASSASFLRVTKNPTQFFVADMAARLIAFIATYDPRMRYTRISDNRRLPDVDLFEDELLEYEIA